jgi:hypothetical protein
MAIWWIVYSKSTADRSDVAVGDPGSGDVRARDIVAATVN